MSIVTGLALELQEVEEAQGEEEDSSPSMEPSPPAMSDGLVPGAHCMAATLGETIVNVWTGDSILLLSQLMERGLLPCGGVGMGGGGEGIEGSLPSKRGNLDTVGMTDTNWDGPEPVGKFPQVEQGRRDRRRRKKSEKEKEEGGSETERETETVPLLPEWAWESGREERKKGREKEKQVSDIIRGGEDGLSQHVIRNPYALEEEEDEEVEGSSGPCSSATHGLPCLSLTHTDRLIQKPVLTSPEPRPRPGPSPDPSQTAHSQPSPRAAPWTSFLLSWLRRTHPRPPPPLCDPSGTPPHPPTPSLLLSLPKIPGRQRKQAATSGGDQNQNQDHPLGAAGSSSTVPLHQPPAPGPAGQCLSTVTSSSDPSPHHPTQPSQMPTPTLELKCPPGTATTLTPTASSTPPGTPSQDIPDTVLRNKFFRDDGDPQHVPSGGGHCGTAMP